MTTKKWFNIHSFTGVITGLLLFFICWTGTFAVISHELDLLVNPEIRVQPQDEKVSWKEMINAAENATEDGKVTSLSKAAYQSGAYTASVMLPGDIYRRAHVNPYTAQVTSNDHAFDIARFFRSLHMNLFGLGTSSIGSYLVMIFGLVLFISLISALFLYKRWWTRFFDFKWTRSGRVFWSQIHKLTGVWSIWFVAIIALSGSYYLYEKLQWDVGVIGPQKLNYVSEEKFGIVQVPDPSCDTSNSILPVDSLIAITNDSWPGFEIESISLQETENGGVIFLASGSSGSTLSRSMLRKRANQINIDARTGKILLKIGTKDLPLYWIISNAADPLHFGNFGGLVSKIIWFIFGLALSGLLLTGTFLHVKRLSKKTVGKNSYRWPGTWAAIGISLLIVLATIPYGFYSASKYYGPLVDGVKQLPTLLPGVKHFIIVWSLGTAAIIGCWVYMLWKPEKIAKYKKTS
jgi:uncharacterized iron-regulated membrane protein